MQDQHQAYQEHLLDATGVCSSCFREIRVRRIDPYYSTQLEAAATLTRKKRNTEIGYGPSQNVTEQQGTFCDQCGTESAFDRTWDDVDFHDPAKAHGIKRFKELIENCILTLESKGVSIDREVFANIALSHYKDGHGIDHCLAEAHEIARTSASMASANERQPAD